MVICPRAGSLTIKNLRNLFYTHQVEKLSDAFLISVIQNCLDEKRNINFFNFFRFYPPEEMTVIPDKFFDFQDVHVMYLSAG